jgi:hypothetical protein
MRKVSKIFRVVKIWYYGKLPYAKKYRHWLRGRLFRSIHELSDSYLKKIIEKYSDNNCNLMMELLSDNSQIKKTQNDKNNRK